MSHSNPSTAVFLINDNVRAIMATYEDGDNAPRTMFKTLDPTIDEDDIVIVPSTTRHKFTTCKVVEVDVDVDFSSPVQVQWIVGKVDLRDHQEILRMEKEALRTIRSAEIRREKEKLKEALLADLNGSTKDMSIAMLADARADAGETEQPPSPVPGS